MATRTKALATELKDLDVDRVDGVDRPATGRAFALYKSKDGNPISKETTMAETTVTKDQMAALLKNYAAVATAADMLLKALRKDAAGKVSKSTAIAVNGLAQIMGSEPVFVSKAVPTHPYEYSEPNVDDRGPADENLGAGFTPRSMPGSMVGKVQFSVKGTEKAQYAAPAVDGEPDADDEKKMPWEKSAAAKAAFDAAVAKAVEAAVAKQAPTVTKVEKTEDKTPVTKTADKPESKQVMTDEQRQIRKSQGYRMGESYSDVVFGR